MDELLKMLDEHLVYLDHKIENDSILIHAISNRKEATCPYCGQIATKIHSHYVRTFQDLPIQGKKVKICVKNQKFFCANPACTHKTFAETFPFLTRSATKTNRLQEEILQISLNQSSVSAAQYLRKNCCTIGKSTICNLLKKR